MTQTIEEREPGWGLKWLGEQITKAFAGTPEAPAQVPGTSMQAPTPAAEASQVMAGQRSRGLAPQPSQPSQPPSEMPSAWERIKYRAGEVPVIGEILAGTAKVMTAIGKGLGQPGVPEMLARMGVGFGISPSGVPSAGARVGQQFLAGREAQQAAEVQQAESERAERLVAAEEVRAGAAATTAEARAIEEAGPPLDQMRLAIEAHIKRNPSHGKTPHLQDLLDAGLIEDAFREMNEIQFETKQGLSPFDLSDPGRLFK